jgi:arsenate reductase
VVSADVKRIPAKATGTDEEKWKVFQRARDEIEERIKRFATEG